MEKNNSRTKLIKMFGKILLFGSSFLIILIFAFYTIWKMSGSYEWKLKIDKNGTQIYTMKTPGSTMTKIKGVTRWKCKLSQICGMLVDESLQEHPSELMPLATEYKILKPFDPKLGTMLMLWRMKLPFPFSPREVLALAQVCQDTTTKELFMDNIVVPNAIPQNEGYVRVIHTHNTWHIIPQENGEVVAECIIDQSFGGFFPSGIVTAIFAAGELYKILENEYPKFLEKYKNLKLDFIDEVSLRKD